MKNIAIIVAAGNSTRFNCDIPKQYFIVNGRSVLNWTVRAFLASNFIDNILVVINKEHKDLYYNSIDEFDILDPIIGGETRNKSVLFGLKALEKINPENVIKIIAKSTHTFAVTIGSNSLLFIKSLTGFIPKLLRINANINDPIKIRYFIYLS